MSLPNPRFSAYGVVSIASHVFFILLAIYIISKFTKKDNIKLSLFVILLCVWPWLYIVWVVIGKSANFATWEFYGNKKYLYWLYNTWVLWIIVRAISFVTHLNKREIVLALLTFLVLVSIPLHYLPGGRFWYRDYKIDDKYEKFNKINLEETYYKQFDFFEELKEEILPERKNVSDVYFVGFGGDASQDVFMKEVQYARALFDEQLKHSFNFIDAFKKAIESIQNREEMEGLEPSEPQLFIGKKIREKIAIIAQELKSYHH